mgnify:CR=1 FL=1
MTTEHDPGHRGRGSDPARSSGCAPRPATATTRSSSASRPRRKTSPRPWPGVYKKAGLAGKPMKVLREIRLQKTEAVARLSGRADPDRRACSAPGEFVDVVGVTKGKGFQGGVKRHGWSGGDATHGSMFHRAPGSIGASSDPSRVWPGHHAARTHGRRPPHRAQPAAWCACSPSRTSSSCAARCPGIPGRLRDGAQEREADQGPAAEGAKGRSSMPTVPVLDATGKAQEHARARPPTSSAAPCAMPLLHQAW